MSMLTSQRTWDLGSWGSGGTMQSLLVIHTTLLAIEFMILTLTRSTLSGLPYSMRKPVPGPPPPLNPKPISWMMMMWLKLMMDELVMEMILSLRVPHVLWKFPIMHCPLLPCPNDLTPLTLGHWKEAVANAYEDLLNDGPSANIAICKHFNLQ